MVFTDSCVDATKVVFPKSLVLKVQPCLGTLFVTKRTGFEIKFVVSKSEVSPLGSFRLEEDAIFVEENKLTISKHPEKYFQVHVWQSMWRLW